MKIFNLPDLGEGLAEAEINQWHVKEGDTIAVDQIMVSVETAKAIVDVPAPFAGTVKKLYGKAGEIIKTGAPLIEFVDVDGPTQDKGTVAGHIEASDMILIENPLGVGIKKAEPNHIKVIPVVRALAKRLNIDLATIMGTGVNGQIIAHDVEAAAKTQIQPDFVPLKGIRRAMAQAMMQSHAEVVPVTLFDNADIHHWPEHTDVTLHIIEALIAACQAEPTLNAWYDGKSMSHKLHTQINLGIALDTPDGLFVPVIKNIAQLNAKEIRTTINQYKEQAKNRSFSPEVLKDATITLSNFGTFAGRYATPIIVPPCVAILGTGRLYEEAISVDGSIAMHKKIPLSLSFDHRAATGGEATRFLKILLQHLSSQNN